jgi:hypothetical protein
MLFSLVATVRVDPNELIVGDRNRLQVALTEHLFLRSFYLLNKNISIEPADGGLSNVSLP